ncbi:MAG: ABC transporter ATP-binding protein [Alphaproteobacteria bacterium]|nr:ABC transporter ATP-binding protein [Alphaproteobacteria bacterium]MBU1560391.1 ABC transporter ATP-binding protein [Alphaproteobacteria bacterium]MBU2303716.1 ABC transporter ATP-binding protein [Alphaproteobacteria bacterium]MBU2366315.1 ABC transporter ATP-binding protein [Alphaproteobacteria bacterium]
MTTQTVLSVEGLSKSFRAVKAVRDVSFTIPKGKTFGLVGESGSGKSTTARLVLRLVEPTSGAISFRGRNLAGLSARDLRAERRHMQMIFQDPFGSLNPRMSVRDTLVEPQLVHGIGTPAEQLKTAERLLAEVSMPRTALDRYPHEFSGGQRQRIAIARALATNPEMIVADEPVSALDVSVQAQVLNLMRDLQDRHGTTMLFISHDLRVVQFMCDEIGVMYLGEIVEQGPRDRIYGAPAHPYTQALLASAPGKGSGQRARLKGEIPSAHAVPSGCAFRTRCPHAFARCTTEKPVMRDMGGGQKAACHLLDGTPAA